MPRYWPPYDDLDALDEPVDPPKMCKFRITRTRTCGGLASGDSGYCLIHYKTPCEICHSQATHNCDDSDIDGCHAPLCDNRYCVASHNINNHVKTWSMEGK